MVQMFSTNNSRVNAILDKLAAMISRSLDPEYILLGGSFGKGSWLFLNEKLLSDFEVVFVCSKKWSLSKKRQLQKELNDNLGVEISLKGYLLGNVRKKIISNYAFSNPGYLSLDFYDTFQHPQYLYSKMEEELELVMTPDEIPLWEAWRLLVNRIGDLLDDRLNKSNDDNFNDYLWMKIYESIGDAYLISKGTYHKSIVERLELIESMNWDEENDLNEVCENSFKAVVLAMKSRAAHDLDLFSINTSIPLNEEIILNWLEYFQILLAKKEGFEAVDSKEFVMEYPECQKLQNKYHGFDYMFNSVFSNGLRLATNRELFGSGFKFWNVMISWRHLSLLSIASYYIESSKGGKSFTMTNNILAEFDGETDNYKNRNYALLNKVVSYWKKLR